ncbi:MAG: GNAT family N-acetyltransferase [Pseudooceanicola sp.]
MNRTIDHDRVSGRHGLKLRAAQALDAGGVGGILADFVEDTPWMPKLYSRAETISFADRMISNDWTIVAEKAVGKGRDVVGFLVRDGQELHALYVARRLRNHGVGAGLIGAAKQASPTLALWCFQANTAAQRFYLRHGFVETGRSDGARNDEGLPDIRYVWKKGRQDD